MKQTTKSFYIKLFNDAINNNRSLKDQCAIAGKSVNTVYIVMRNLRKKEHKDEDDKKILELYDKLKNTKKKEVKKDTDDASNTWEIRDKETGKITGYKFEIFRRNKPAITGVFTRNEMNSVYRMYTYYGSGLTQQIVSRYFPDYSLIDFKRILRAFNITKASSPFAPHMYEEYTEDELKEMHLREKENDFLKRIEKDEVKDLRALVTKLTKETSKSLNKELIETTIKNTVKDYKELPVNINNKEAKYPDLIIWLSDLHIGAYNAKYSSFVQLPSYDITEIKSRLSRIVESFVEQEYHSVYIVNLGDSIDGFNKETTRGGHELPEILDNKEISEAFIECMMEFFATLTVKVKSKDFNYLSIGESNHGGDFEWLNQKLLAAYLTKYNVKSYISNYPIDNFIIGNHQFLYAHGKNNTSQTRQFPLTLNPQTELYFANYIAEKGICSPHIYVVKGDLHNYAYTTGKQFDYISVGSMYGSSNYITANFGHTKWSINYTIVKDKDILMGTIKGNN